MTEPILAPLLRFKIAVRDQHTTVAAPQESFRQLIVVDEQNLAALLAAIRPQPANWLPNKP
jgi:hypothetical protein